MQSKTEKIQEVYGVVREFDHCLLAFIVAAFVAEFPYLNLSEMIKELNQMEDLQK